MSKGALGVIALLAAALGIFAAHPVQSQGLLVSNAGQPHDASSEYLRMGVRSTIPWSERLSWYYRKVAQRFRVGDEPGGFTITAVELYLHGLDETDRLNVQIARRGSDGDPGATHAVLTNPDTLSNESFNTFTAPAGTRLHSQLEYFIVVEVTHGLFYVGYTDSWRQDSGARSGWTIANLNRGSVSGTQFSEGNWYSPVRMKIHGMSQAEEAESAEPLTASVDSAPEHHDGETLFDVRIAFSEDIKTSYKDLDDGFAVTGGEIDKVRRVDRRSDLWRITVEPSGDEDVTLELEGGRPCSVTGAPCAKSSNAVLSETLTLTVPREEEEDDDDAGESTALTAQLDAPAEHGGPGSSFEVEVTFSDDIDNSYKYVDNAAYVLGGTATKARRVNRRDDHWAITVRATGDEIVVFSLRGGGECAGKQSPVLCTEDERVLSHSPTAEIRGPAAISVADARAQEGVDATIDFTVSLDRAATHRIEVDYATRDGSATAGEDYTAASGTLAFEVGDTEKTVSVTLRDDAVDEGEETFELVLSNASSARIADGTATGTIANSDPLQQDWIARFGRTVASQAVEAIGDRLGGGGRTRIEIAGRTIDGNGTIEEENEEESTLSLFDDGDRWGGADEAATLNGRDLVMRSSFQFRGGDNGGGGVSWGAWGRFAQDRFEADADADGLKLEGDVTTAFLGADAARDRWLAGMALSMSEGDGPYRHESGDSGEVESTLTAVYPYARWSATERVDLWGTLGVGAGEMTIRDEGGDTDRETDISMRMGAIGAQGRVLSAAEGQALDVTARTDALWLRMKSDAVHGNAAGGGNLEAAQADVTRFRLALEASRAFEMDAERVLTPSLAVGLRHDGGDAETGAGIEVGGGIAYAGEGITVEGRVRALVAHEASGYEEWGASGSVRIDPGQSGRGLTFTLAPSWGESGSTTEQLWDSAHSKGIARDDDFDARRGLEAELGYGLRGLDGTGVLTPYTGASWGDEGDRTILRTGARWQIAPETVLGFEAARARRSATAPADAAIRIRIETRW